MKKNLLILFFLMLFVMLVLPVSAWDWGLMADQSASMDNTAGAADSFAGAFSYSGTLLPWISAPLGETGKLHIAIGTTFEYRDEKPVFIPELLRTEVSFQIGGGAEIKAGRMPYADPLGFVASGLFDGARFALDSDFGVFGTGVWYTGLLYKKNAQITMTTDDAAAYSAGLDEADIAGTYFASRRLIAALDWNSANLGERIRLKIALIGQFDLNDNENRYHSQYLAVKASVPVKSFVFDAGGCFEFAEITGADTGQQNKIGLAGELGIAWLLPSSLHDRLLLTGRFASGRPDGDSAFTAFVPVTTSAQGDLIDAKLSGISMLRLEYSARLHENFMCGAASSYFILSDLVTYQGLPRGRDGHFLGNEFSGRVTWTPFSDLRLTVGGGVFLPSLGDAGKTADPVWQAEVSAILVIF